MNSKNNKIFLFSKTTFFILYCRLIFVSFFAFLITLEHFCCLLYVFLILKKIIKILNKDFIKLILELELEDYYLAL